MEKSIKQLGYCNAYVEIERSGDYAAYTLVSYCTAVARIAYRSNTYVYAAVGAAAHCSATTSKHVARFFDEYGREFAFVPRAQYRDNPGYDFKDSLLYDNIFSEFRTGLYLFSNKPDRTPYKDFNNGYMIVRGLHRG